MPRFDGTGPQGQGQMTGRQQGYCVLPADRVPTPPTQSGTNVTVGRGRGTGFGQGFGRGRGTGFGRGRGAGFGRGRVW